MNEAFDSEASKRYSEEMRKRQLEELRLRYEAEECKELIRAAAMVLVEAVKAELTDTACFETAREFLMARWNRMLRRNTERS